MNNPQFAKVNNVKYKINTDYRIALKCQEVAEDDTISDYERSLAIIYLLFGEKGLECDDINKLLELGIKYLQCGQDEKENNAKKDMDYKQDFRLIKASFKSDYGIVLDDEKMHWYDFYSYLNGLTDNCILSRVREIRTYDVSKIKDVKEKKKILDLQEQYKLKNNVKKKEFTEEQIKAQDEFYNLLNRK